MNLILKLLTITVVSSILTACAPTISQRIKNADTVAKKHEFLKTSVRGGKFWLTSYQKVIDPYAHYAVYIEGDGMIASRNTITEDPTPRKPMLLSLAVQDKRPNIIYLARPCQYDHNFVKNPICNQSYWTNKRMSEDSVEAVSEAITHATRGNPVHLIGFSGGGGIAVLVAQRNKAVRSITTIAGNLDHVAFNNYHHSLQMTESLNPIDVAQKVNYIPQLHVSGALDNVIPPFIADRFVEASGTDKCITRYIAEEAGHTSGWENEWQKILNIPILCKKQ